MLICLGERSGIENKIFWNMETTALILVCMYVYVWFMQVHVYLVCVSMSKHIFVH